MQSVEFAFLQVVNGARGIHFRLLRKQLRRIGIGGDRQAFLVDFQLNFIATRLHFILLRSALGQQTLVG